MSQVVIITSGGSQLITQLATLFYLKGNCNAEVYYTGLESSELDGYFLEFCSNFGLQYRGSLNYKVKKYPIKNADILSEKILRKLKNGTQHIIQANFKLDRLKYKTILIPLRHKVEKDLFLISALQPKQLILSADGVVDKAIYRDFTSWRWRKLNRDLAKIPTTASIYSPDYLKDDTEKLGRAVRIPSDFLLEIINSSKELKCFNYLKEAIYENGKPNSIVFSQHLALIKSCSEEEEIGYYTDVLNYLLSKGMSPVIFKPHPRDTELKLSILKEKFRSESNKVHFLDKKASVVPIELMKNCLQADIQLITASSSAPLGILKELGNLKILNSRALPKPLRSEIDRFAGKHHVKPLYV